LRDSVPQTPYPAELEIKSKDKDKKLLLSLSLSTFICGFKGAKPL